MDKAGQFGLTAQATGEKSPVLDTVMVSLFSIRSQTSTLTMEQRAGRVMKFHRFHHPIMRSQWLDEVR